MKVLKLRVEMFLAYYLDLIFRDRDWAMRAYRARLHGLKEGRR